MSANRRFSIGPVDPDLARPEGWMALALCAQTDPDAYFPDPGGQNGSGAQAKQVCRRCEVSDQCLSFAMKNDMRYGIWGGLGAQARHRLRKQADADSTVTLRMPALPERLAG